MLCWFGLHLKLAPAITRPCAGVISEFVSGEVAHAHFFGYQTTLPAEADECVEELEALVDFEASPVLLKR